MDRFGAIVWMAANPRAIVNVPAARALCTDIGVPFLDVLELDGAMIRKPRADTQADASRRDGWLVGSEAVQTMDLIQVSDLAAAMARYVGEYANVDQAKSSQHGTPGKVAQYITQRACVRLAFHFFGKSGHTDRYMDDPAVKRLVSEVPSIRTSGVRSKMKGVDGKPIVGFDGRPIFQGGDQMLIEKVYRVSSPA